MLSIKLYILQRVTALIMAPLVLLHLGVMVVAIQGGLTSEEILGRTQGSWFWACVYGLFVAAVAVHGSIGLRAIAYEWAGLRGSALTLLSWVFGLAILLMGSRAVFAVVWL